ncbi:phosphogluconate 2-dehydrogenase/gluconate 2-dehydrogenase [Microbispora rosea]|uniref:Phosphogluconate 2-dehydrogenase/gluconate 2-dehydrogenase n=1 Tax=Microbispora rosea TaxID=58117 RepID=A0A1N6Z8U1_9ACTN|nr:phosphogluconate 2-dehydrogenase/gluconate 2-dehydrogenase [Microbispora rosea]
MSQTAAPRDITDYRPAQPRPAAGAELRGGTVLVTGAGIDTALLEPLARQGLTVRRPASPLTEDLLARELRGAVAYLHGGEERATARALRKAHKTLKVVAFLGVGYENFVDVAAADRLGIAVTNTRGAATDAVATFTVAQIVNANLGIPRHLGERVPGWQGSDELPHELAARKVGIIGMGANGRRIAEILRRGFGVRVSYYSRTRKPEVERDLGISYLSLLDLAASSDILVVMVPETGETRSMVDSSVIGRMPEGAILVNTARPAIVSPGALYTGLEKGRVSMAVFDGFYGRECEEAGELRRDFPDRLLVTGHIASHTAEAMHRMVRQAVKSIENVLTRGSDEHEVGTRPRPRF